MNPKDDSNTENPATSQPPAGAIRPLDHRVWLALFILLAVTVGLYWPVLHCDYINFDDPQYASQNQIVQAGLTPPGMVWAFTAPVASNWHPLTMISLMLDCDLLGDGPGGHHLVNLILHALNTGLVFLFLRQITGAYWRSLLVAAWFGWHPLHVESVAWISERKDVLSTFFWLLALWCYGLYAQGVNTTVLKPKHFYVLTLLFTALGLMSKAMLVTMPCVLLLLDYWPLNRWQPGQLKPLLREKVPFALLAAAFSIVTFIVQKQTGAMTWADIFPLEARVRNAVFAYGRYLLKTVWPSHLTIVYPYPITGHWQTRYVAVSLLVLVAISLWARISSKKSPFLLMGWWWFLVTLVPVIGLIQVGKQAMADRYTYVPLIGIFIMVAWGFQGLAAGRRVPQMLLIGASIATLPLCLAATRQELGYWKNTVTLFERAVAVEDDNYIAEQKLAHTYLEQGNNELAINHFKKAVSLDPRSVPCHVHLGVAYLRENRFDDALEEFQEGVRLDPDNAIIHLNLGEAFFNKGMADDAIAEFQKTLQLDPNNTDAPGLLARANDLKANQAAMKDVENLNNQAWDLATNSDPTKRDGTKAVALAESACQQTQYRIPVVVGTLAAAYAEAGRFNEAVVAAQKACDLAAETGETNVASRNRELIKLYQAHQAYHQ